MRCLVIDDERHDREVIARVVARAGHEAVCAEDAAAGVALVSGGKAFDVALVDLGMPGVDGVATLQLLRRAAPDLRLLVVSGWDDRRHVIAAVAAGADGYVVKSDLEALARAIEDVVAGGGPMSRQIAHFVLEELRVDDAGGQPSEVGGAGGAGGAGVTGERVLSRRQWEVLKEIARGLTYKQIADSLMISENTVRHHIRVISKKLAVKGGKEAVRYVLGAREPDDPDDHDDDA